MAGTLFCPNGHEGAGPDDAFCSACGAALKSDEAHRSAVAMGLLGLTWPQSLLAVAGAIVLLGGAIGSGLLLRDEPAQAKGLVPASAVQSAPTRQPALASSPVASPSDATVTSSGAPGTDSAPAPGSGSGGAAGVAAPAVNQSSGSGSRPTATRPPATPTSSPTATRPAPTATNVPPTATQPPPTNTPLPTLPPNIRVYGTMTVGGSSCGGCEAALVGPKQVVFKAASSGSYDTKALGFALTPGTYNVFYTCNGKLVSTGQSIVLVGPDVKLDIKIGFCG